jgi:conjugal transfer pilus assembly protein TraE
MDFDRLSGDLKDMRRRNRGLGLVAGALAAAKSSPSSSSST